MTSLLPPDLSETLLEESICLDDSVAPEDGPEETPDMLLKDTGVKVEDSDIGDSLVPKSLTVAADKSETKVTEVYCRDDSNHPEQVAVDTESTAAVDNNAQEDNGISISVRSDHGYMVQPIGSPNSKPDLCKYFAEESAEVPTSSQLSVLAEVNVPPEQDAINFFKMSDRETAGDTEGKAFFDSISNEALEKNAQRKHTVSQSSEGPASIFTSQVSTESASEFFATVGMGSDFDTSVDAWIPSERTRQSLIDAARGVNVISQDLLTMPGIIIQETMGDPVRDLVVKYMGEHEAVKRTSLIQDRVTYDMDGLVNLINARNYHAAIDLTGQLLTGLGQGPDMGGRPSTNTPQTLQLWFLRMALMVRLQKYSFAEVEIESFGDLDRPDLYYEFYPDVYKGRKGSMVPFSFRLLHAELPQYTGKPNESVNRLHSMCAIVTKILQNLAEGRAEDGSMVVISSKQKEASIKLWKKREIKLLYALVHVLLVIKDCNLAAQVAEQIVEKDPDNSAEMLSNIGRMYLQIGCITAAENCFYRVSTQDGEETVGKVSQQLMNSGYLCIAKGSYSEALALFREAKNVNPNNISAVNNVAVCLLYHGKLKEAIATLEELVKSDSSGSLHDGAVFNLCTLYELESSKALKKKQGLLDIAATQHGDGFSTASLKLA